MNHDFILIIRSKLKIKVEVLFTGIIRRRRGDVLLFFFLVLLNLKLKRDGPFIPFAASYANQTRKDVPWVPGPFNRKLEKLFPGLPL